jgi:hypothetical protein
MGRVMLVLRRRIFVRRRFFAIYLCAFVVGVAIGASLMSSSLGRRPAVVRAVAFASGLARSHT